MVNDGKRKEPPISIRVIQLRKQYDAIVYGSYQLLLENHPSVFAYKRELNDEKLYVICNFNGKTTTGKLNENISKAKFLISHYDRSPLEKGRLKPYEVRVYLKKN